MRLVFAGTPEFAVSALSALHAAGHDIVGVYTQPDRPAGRGQKLSASAVSLRAQQLGLPLFKPVKLVDAAVDELRALRPELMVVVAYGLILSQTVLDIPAQGCINIHASLLPRWRGAAPIQRAILAGDAATGVTIMRMEAGLDTGPMLLADQVSITERTTAATLHDELAAMGARLIVQTLAQLDALPAVMQPEQGVTYARKISKDEARIDWTLGADELARRVRGYNPMPVAWCELEGERIRVFSVRVASGKGAPGQVLDVGAAGIRVATGSGALLIEQLQRPGGKPLSAMDVTHGWNLTGKHFA